MIASPDHLIALLVTGEGHAGRLGTVVLAFVTPVLS